MKLYGHPDSGHALKVKFFLEWLDVDHEYEYVDIFADPSTRENDFLSASKFSEVPTLIDNDQAYIQSNAILVYLANKYDIFKNADEKQSSLEWLIWEANKIGMCLPQLRANEKFGNDNLEFKLSQGAYDWLKARYDYDVGVLDQELADKKFILGNDITPADFSLSAYLMYADEAAVDVPQNIEQWLNRIREMKGWQSPYEMLRA